VLTRAKRWLPVVLLLGGSQLLHQGHAGCWKANIPKIWEEPHTPLPEGSAGDLIRTPDNAQYFAAIGSVEFGQVGRRRNRPHIGLQKTGVVR